MKVLFPIRLLSLLATLSIPAFANPELDALQRRCEMQEERIRELEGLLGISTTPSGVKSETTRPQTGYKVVAGDTLERIARKHDCSLAGLLATNQLKADAIIHPGQELRIPAIQAAAPTGKAQVGSKSAPAAAAKYTVAKGDTLSAIARNHNVSLNELLTANPDVKPTALRPGQVINLVDKKREEPEPAATTVGKKDLARSSNHPETTPTPKKTKIQPVQIDREMTYQEFASLQGTTTLRLNQLNGLDLIDAAKLAKGSELLAPTALP